MAGAAPPLGAVEREAPAAQPVLRQQGPGPCRDPLPTAAARSILGSQDRPRYPILLAAIDLHGGSLGVGRHNCSDGPATPERKAHALVRQGALVDDHVAADRASGFDSICRDEVLRRRWKLASVSTTSR